MSAAWLARHSLPCLTRAPNTACREPCALALSLSLTGGRSALPALRRYLAKPGARPYCSAQPQVVSLPAFESWAPKELVETHAPKLPEAFWKKHGPTPHCVIRSPNPPIADNDW